MQEWEGRLRDGVPRNRGSTIEHEALREIAKDSALAAEILRQIDEHPDLGELLANRGRTAEEPAATAALGPVTADRARALLEAAPDTRADPDAEALVLTLGRPVLPVVGDDVDLSAIRTDTWRTRLGSARDALRRAIPSVGRIELVDHPWLDWAGTAWVVRDDVVVTNRHVAESFARREADGFVFRAAADVTLGARIDFRDDPASEVDHDAGTAVVSHILHIEPETGPDLAFLRVQWNGGAGRRAPIGLATTLDHVRDVVLIGHSARDTRVHVSSALNRIFADVHDVKHVAPGQLVGRPATTD